MAGPNFIRINLRTVFRDSSCFAKGTFGLIYGPCKADDCEYLIKEISLSSQQQTRIGKLEGRWKRWPTLKHKNLIQIYEVQLINSELYYAMEYAIGGSLRDFLKETRTDLPVDVMTVSAAQIASAMYYLHEKNIVHRDFKSPNVVILEALGASESLSGKTLKITDFDSLKENDQTRTKSCNEMHLWTAPEVLQSTTSDNISPHIVKESDVYSFGVVLWEMATRKLPFTGRNTSEATLQVMKGTYTWEIPGRVQENLKQLMADCLEHDLEKRPTFSQIWKKLKPPASLTNDEIRDRIRHQYAEFVSSVDPNHLGDWLKKDRIISFDEWQKILHDNRIPKDRCRAILDHLFTIKHPKAFVVLRNALKHQDHFILQKIDSDESDHIEQPVSLSNEDIKRRIQNVYNQFVAEVNPAPLSDWLIQEGVISPDQWQAFSQKNPTNSERCRALLDHLFITGHPKAFLVVAEALKYDNHRLAEQFAK